MTGLPDDPAALVPQQLNSEDSLGYERRTVAVLRDALLDNTGGLLLIDDIELVGTRPRTLVVFRYHHRPQYIGHHPAMRPGPCAEVARLWDFAFDPEDTYAGGMMDAPGVLAAAIASAFDAAELPLVDPHSLRTVGTPPNIFPRRQDPPGPT